MPTLAENPVLDIAAPPSGANAGSLQRQLTRRFIGVFVLVALLGSLAGLGGYRAIIGRAQHNAANDTAQHIEKNYASMQDDWQRNADEVKAQIDFMRIFADGGADSWLRLRAYFAALEGKVGKFPAGVVMPGKGGPLFRFGSDASDSLSRALEGKGAQPGWHYDSEHGIAYALKSAPLWLGAQGKGRMVLMQPVDAAVLRTLAPLDVSLALVMGGRVLASSEGSEEVGKSLDSSFSGPLMVGGLAVEQRVVAAFGGDSAAPLLVMRQTLRDPLSTQLILLSSMASLALLALILWLVVGRWTQTLAARILHLSNAVGQFARHHQLTQEVQQGLENATGEPDEISGVAESSHDLMQSVVAYVEEHLAYVQTLDILEEGVVELDRDGHFVRASPGWTKLSGNADDSGGLIFDSIHPEDVKALKGQFTFLFSGKKASATGRLRLKRTDATEEIWIEYRFVPGVAGPDGIAGVRGVLRDITQSYLLEKHISHMALHDALTGLPNRVLLEDRTKIALRMADRSSHKVAVGFIDLDHFKDINDHFGHSAGDQVLVSLAGSLRQCLRSGDTLARWGGDEFVVLLSDVSDIEGAREVAAKLITACEKPIVIDGTDFNVTFSMGVAVYPDDANTTETLLSQADRAMFFAKDLGRNNVRFFSDVLRKDDDRRALYIQNRLAAAIKNQEIQAWFQPVVAADGHRLVGCEALARWHDETYGWVSPATFIPMAENLGLINELGMLVWRQALESLRRWRGKGMDLHMAVNVSRRQLFTANFTAEMLADLERHDIPVQCLELEITESVAMEDAQHTLTRLQELVGAGFGIAIDDFGTGYSSLSQLHNMPATKLKIDISFVRRIHTTQGAQLVTAIVQMARAFKLKTVAEGVEDEKTALALQGLGVALLQGYHFGKPMAAEDFERLFAMPPIAAS